MLTGKKEKKILAKQISLDERTPPKFKVFALLINLVLSSTGADQELWTAVLKSTFVDKDNNVSWNGGVAAQDSEAVEHIKANQEVKTLLKDAAQLIIGGNSVSSTKN